MLSKPAKKDATQPATKLGGEKYGLTNRQIAPPKIVEIALKYGPRIMPRIGEITVAAVMALPNKPISCERGKNESIT
ncbi:MAG: hypothetical protein QXZ25_00960 [Candidatus Bathyarchaeia archaeon]